MSFFMPQLSLMPNYQYQNTTGLLKAQTTTTLLITDVPEDW